MLDVPATGDRSPAKTPSSRKVDKSSWFTNLLQIPTGQVLKLAAPKHPMNQVHLLAENVSGTLIASTATSKTNSAIDSSINPTWPKPEKTVELVFHWVYSYLVEFA